LKSKSIILLIICLLGIAVFAMLSMSGGHAKKAVVGLPAPDFELKDAQGNTVRLSDLRGKVVMLNFWATWCDSCKEENPSLHKFVNSESGNPNFVFLSILYNDQPANAIQYQKETGFNFPVLVDDKRTYADYGLTGVPETFIINKKGILAQKVIGPIRWDTPDVSSLISKLASE
jgi:peroxiredoxin